MYQRMVLFPHSGIGLPSSSEFKILTGAANDYGLLPPVLNINNQIEYIASLNESDKEQLQSESYNARIVYQNGHIATVAESQSSKGSGVGIIGNNNYEFYIDFYAKDLANAENTDDIVSYADLLKLYLRQNQSGTNSFISYLHNYIYDDLYSAVNRKFLFDKFFILELNDYSYQAMTSNNYDFDIKLFINDNNVIYKIPQSAICIIKSYTYKKIWVLIDKYIYGNNGFNSIENLKYMIIDFKYKFTNFSAYYNKANLTSLYDDLTNSSPYYDYIHVKNNGEPDTISVLNQQSRYFEYSFSKPKEEIDKFEIEKTLLIEDNTNNLKKDVVKFQSFILLHATRETINKYANSLGYEVYAYSNGNLKENLLYGKRIFDASDIRSENFSNYSFEIFPISPALVHYVFNVTSDFTMTKDLDSNIKKIQKWMYKNNIYLNNYRIKNINIIPYFQNNIVNTSRKYLELYIPLPYDGDSNSIDVDISANIPDITASISTKAKYNGSYYDPENLDETGIYDSNIAIPYVYYDKFIPKKQAGSIFIADIDDQVDDNANSYKNFKYKNLEEDKFDIRAIINSNSNSVLPERKNMKISNDIENIVTRKSLEQNIELQAEEQFSTICSNLSKLITTKEELISNIKNIDMTDCLFVYIDVNDAKFLKIVKTYDSGETTAMYLKSFKQEKLNKNIVILPSEYYDNISNTHLVYFNILDNDNCKCYKVY